MGQGRLQMIFTRCSSWMKEMYYQKKGVTAFQP